MLKKYNYQAKTYDDAVSLAKAELMDTEENLFIRETENSKSLFNKKSVIEVVKKEDVLEYIKEMLKDITKYMGLSVQMEVKKRDDSVSISLFSDNNAILIGKDARTMEALNTIIRQAINNEIGEYFKFTLDVSEYKAKQHHNIERAAKMTAKEVARTKVPAKLEPMNSYERRLVHNALTGFRGIYTESEGSEPNRCVVIKPLEKDIKTEVKEEVKEEIKEVNEVNE